MQRTTAQGKPCKLTDGRLQRRSPLRRRGTAATIAALPFPTTMRIHTLCVASLIVLSSGCASAEERERARAEKGRKKQEEQERKTAEADAAMHQKLPPGSPFQPIRFGWSEGEVQVALGEPTTKDTRLTGREYIPFNFGGRGSVQTTWYYKGKGRVVFLGATGGVSNRVIDAIDDPNEIGHFVTK